MALSIFVQYNRHNHCCKYDLLYEQNKMITVKTKST